MCQVWMPALIVGSPLMKRPALHLSQRAAFYFPYQNQFFVTEEEAIRELGMDPRDPNWELIGYDWVRPIDNDGWERLKEKRMLKPL